MAEKQTGKVIGYLMKPYPHLHKRWMILIMIPLFVALFMLTFQPFGLQASSIGHKNLLLLGYGLVTLVLLAVDMYLLPLIMPRLFNEKKWTILSEIFYQLGIVLSIAAGNYFYSVATSITGWHGMYGLMIFIFFTVAVAIIPILGIILISHNHLLRQNLAGAGEISRIILERKEASVKEDKLILSSGNGKQSIETTAFQLVCIESEGNYTNTWCIEDGRIMQHVIRNTVKNIENQIGGAAGLMRCHRAYIVNLRYVEQVEGNSQGYQLQLKYIHKQIPVSRNYTKEFNQAFRNWK